MLHRHSSDPRALRDRLPAGDERDAFFDTFVMLKAHTSSWMRPIDASGGYRWRAGASPLLSIAHIIKEVDYVMA